MRPLKMKGVLKDLFPNDMCPTTCLNPAASPSFNVGRHLMLCCFVTAQVLQVLMPGYNSHLAWIRKISNPTDYLYHRTTRLVTPWSESQIS